MNITARQLAEIIYEELDRDSWGDIDSYLFEAVAKCWDTDKDNDDADDTRALLDVLNRVASRLNGEQLAHGKFTV